MPVWPTGRVPALAAIYLDELSCGDEVTVQEPQEIFALGSMSTTNRCAERSGDIKSHQTELSLQRREHWVLYKGQDCPSPALGLVFCCQQGDDVPSLGLGVSIWFGSPDPRGGGAHLFRGCFHFEIQPVYNDFAFLRADADHLRYVCKSRHPVAS